MRSTTFFALAIVPLRFFAQAECDGARYVDMAYFDSVQVTAAVPFGSNINPWPTPSTQTLYMDVYEPAGDTIAERPVVLVGFGGSFISGTRADVAPLCDAFARLGHVAIAFDYRVGPFSVNEAGTVKAVMRCMHDLKACVRFLRKTVAEDGNPYRIDMDRIIIGGVSAGAVGALHAAYMDQPSEIPAVVLGDTATLGGIEGNSGSPAYSSEVLACWSMSGAVGDTAWIQAGDQPLCSIHETGDNVVPCWTEEVYVIGFPTGLMASGSGHIHPRMDNLGIENCLTIYPGTGHVGYLSSDPQGSMDRVVQFLKHVVCDEPAGCPPLFVGIDAPVAMRPLRPYPNPTDGFLALEAEESSLVEVVDLQGRVLLREPTTQGVHMIDLTAFAPGVYMIRLNSDPLRSALVVKR